MRKVDPRRKGSDWLVKYEADKLGRRIEALTAQRAILLQRLRSRRHMAKKRDMLDADTREALPL